MSMVAVLSIRHHLHVGDATFTSAVPHEIRRQSQAWTKQQDDTTLARPHMTPPMEIACSAECFASPASRAARAYPWARSKLDAP
jgi:hypothetical protein